MSTRSASQVDRQQRNLGLETHQTSSAPPAQHPLAPSSAHRPAVPDLGVGPSSAARLAPRPALSSTSSFSSASSRPVSPGVSSRRRKNNAVPFDLQGGPDGAGARIRPERDDNYDDDDDDPDHKRRPFHAATKHNTNVLDRLESIFGLGPDPVNGSSSVQRKPFTNHKRQPDSGTRLVLQHEVAASDTLQSLALRYKTDAATLRRVNGLWPGDSVLTRKILWVPLDRCRELAAGDSAKLGVQKSNGEIQEAEGVIAELGDSSAPTHSTSSSAMDSSSSPPTPASPVVRRLPAEALGHFPASRRSETVAKGKAKAADEWNEEVLSARPSYRLGPGPGSNAYQPGETGVEDLLQLARQAQKKRGEQGLEPQAAEGVDVFGKSKPQTSAPSVPRSSSSASTRAEQPLLEQSIREWQATRDQNANGNTYQGWNDAPTLQAYANGRVAQAYNSKSARNKRPARAHHRFLDDLAAGLPPNTGAASKWARPIGDSMPSKGGSQARSAGAGGVGFRSLLSDAIRGRVGLDEALSKGFEEVLNRSEAWNTLPQEELEHARRLGKWPQDARMSPRPQRLQVSTSTERISAEEARRGLGTPTESDFSSSPTHSRDDGSFEAHGSPQRRRSQHEMSDLPRNSRAAYSADPPQPGPVMRTQASAGRRSNAGWIE
ncbi:unnamed protein product [Jaminaea pallidilutea]